MGWRKLCRMAAWWRLRPVSEVRIRLFLPRTNLNWLVRKGLTEMAEVEPTGKTAKEPWTKLDVGKAPVNQGVIEYFPRALLAVAEVSAFGAKKYSWSGWGEG